MATIAAAFVVGAVVPAVPSEQNPSRRVVNGGANVCAVHAINSWKSSGNGRRSTWAQQLSWKKNAAKSLVLTSSSSMRLATDRSARCATTEEIDAEKELIEEDTMERMEKTMETVKASFNSVRTGRASPNLLGHLEGQNPGRTLAGRNVKRGGIGSGRRRRGRARQDKMQAETDTTLPFLEPQVRRHKEEGHQVLVDVEYLLLRATNPYGLVLEIAEEANEYLRNNKEDSLRRKPVLKMISDRINEAAGEQLEDSYIDDHPDYEKYETL